MMIVMVNRYSSTNNFPARECLKLSRKKIVGTFAFALTLHGIQKKIVGDFAAVKRNIRNQDKLRRVTGLHTCAKDRKSRYG